MELGSLEEVHRLYAALSSSMPAGVLEMIVGARTLLLRLDGTPPDPIELGRRLRDFEATSPPVPSRLIRIPVVYDGTDLASVARELGLRPADVVRLHSAATYTVGFLGFSPGFAYLFGGPPELEVSRRASPRTSVPAGAVALAGGMTAVYPQATPGGWRLIGRTGEVMFDPRQNPPARLAPRRSSALRSS